MQLNQRYIRQQILPGFGIGSQEKLTKAKVLIIGMGGLGCPILQYLVGAGVGTIGIMDGDKISESNLHRQLLYDTNQLGLIKVEVAASKMRLQNPLVQIHTHPYSLFKENAFQLIEQYDFVIDATDNFIAKYLINDVSVILNKPWIYGAVSGFEGQIAVFNLKEADRHSLNYRHLFPEQPEVNEIPTCEEAGIIGVLPGIIGTMQAAEAIKIITGIGKPLQNTLLNYNLITSSWYSIHMDSAVSSPTINQQFFDEMIYDHHCVWTENDIDVEDIDVDEIDVTSFVEIQNNKDIFILDVREFHEYPVIDFAHAQIPMSALKQSIAQLPNLPIYVICHQGIRSIYAAQLIKLQKSMDVYSVKGGLTAYFNQINHEQ
jgi:adenylyltransferase/sulfurtransferase